jgi:hypothetical protein
MRAKDKNLIECMSTVFLLSETFFYIHWHIFGKGILPTPYEFSIANLKFPLKLKTQPKTFNSGPKLIVQKAHKAVLS